MIAPEDVQLAVAIQLLYAGLGSLIDDGIPDYVVDRLIVKLRKTYKGKKNENVERIPGEPAGDDAE